MSPPSLQVAFAKMMASFTAEERSLPVLAPVDAYIRPSHEMPTFVCPLREEQMPVRKMDGLLDGWKQKLNGEHACSFCSSISPTGLVVVMREAVDEASPTHVIPSREPGKIYLHRESVRYMAEGAVKFASLHLPEVGTAEREVIDELWPRAMLASARKVERNYLEAKSTMR